MEAAREVDVSSVLEVGKVWSGHPVGFALLTSPPIQFVAYYDEERRMTVASRTLGNDNWFVRPLPEQLGWDSHNYITMAIDERGHLHLAGNMHVNPLVYFRTERPYEIESLVRVSSMVGTEEARVTYPSFFKGPDGELLFTYRDGSSGRGNQVYNKYDVATRTWRRLLDTPLIDGGGRMNAYVHGPLAGPDGYYHMAWVWRDTPDAATNHDVSYARSKDLVHWERSDGTPYQLPITIDTAEIVDPVPPFGGAINGNVKIGFDFKDRVIISYHKYDEDGITQLYNARRESDGWRIHQTGNWDYRWDFGGGGSIPFEVGIQPVRVVGDGRLVQSYSHVKYGRVQLSLNEENLQPDDIASAPSPYPSSLTRPEIEFAGIGVRWAEDLGESGEEGVRYLLRWETLGPNRDRPRTGELPPPSALRVVEVVEASRP